MIVLIDNRFYKNSVFKKEFIFYNFIVNKKHLFKVSFFESEVIKEKVLNGDIEYFKKFFVLNDENYLFVLE